MFILYAISTQNRDSISIFIVTIKYLKVSLYNMRAPLAQAVNNLSTMQETQVRSLDWEDPLEKGAETHFNILSWRIPWTEEPGRLQSMGLQRVEHD